MFRQASQAFDAVAQITEALGGRDCPYPADRVRAALEDAEGNPDEAIELLLEQEQRQRNAGSSSSARPRTSGVRAVPVRAPLPRRQPETRKPRGPGLSRELKQLMEDNARNLPKGGAKAAPAEDENETSDREEVVAGAMEDGTDDEDPEARAAEDSPSPVKKKTPAKKKKPTVTRKRKQPADEPEDDDEQFQPAKRSARLNRTLDPAVDARTVDARTRSTSTKNHREEPTEEEEEADENVELARVGKTERIHLGDVRIEVGPVPAKLKKPLDQGKTVGPLQLISNCSGVGTLDVFATRETSTDCETDGLQGLQPFTTAPWPARHKRRSTASAPLFASLCDDPDTSLVACLQHVVDPNGPLAGLVHLWKAGWIELRSILASTKSLEAADAAKARSRSKGKQKESATDPATRPLPPRLVLAPKPGVPEHTPAPRQPYTIVVQLFLTEKALTYGTTPDTAKDSFVQGRHHPQDRHLFPLISALAKLNEGRVGTADMKRGEYALFDLGGASKWHAPIELGRQYLTSLVAVGADTDSFYTGSKTFYNPYGDASVYAREEIGDLGSDLDGLLEYVRPCNDAREHEAPNGLTAQLLPFQRKALFWMKQKETEFRQDGEDGLHPLWWALELKGRGGKKRTVYLNEITGTLSFKRFPPAATEPGGCLADEMGLGKTVEVLSLILAHPRDFTVPDPSRSARIMATIVDPDERPVPVKATLVVAPQAIMQQWIDETAKHAPGLECMTFRERAYWNSRDHGILGRERQMATELFSECDVVFATYETLQVELRRSSNSKKSLLLWAQWWRIVLDEAQMVADSNGSAATMAGELWRVNGWAVTGTPINNALNDIHGLLTFLDSDPFASRDVIRHSIMEPFESRVPSGIQRLRGLLSKFLWRHNKGHVKHEYELPECTEERIELDFVQAERLFYRKMHTDARDYLKAQFTVNDGTLTMTSGVTSRMTALRQCADHPQLTGQYNATANKNWDKLQNKTLTYEEIIGEILRKAESELETAEHEYVNEVLLVGYGTLQRELQGQAAEDSDDEDELEPPPKHTRKQLEELYLSCFQIVERNIDAVVKLDRSILPMLEYFGHAKLMLRKWLRNKWHLIAAVRALDDNHPLLEALDADNQQAYFDELLEGFDFSHDEIEGRYWLKNYKQVSMIRNEEEGLRRKRVNEVTLTQRRPLLAIEKSMETMASKMRSKQAEVNHVRSRMAVEMARKAQRSGQQSAGPSNGGDPMDVDEDNVGGPLGAPGPSNAVLAADPVPDTSTCTICFEEIEEPAVTPCAHEFCLQCIKGVLEVSPHCPLCRTKLNARDLKIAAATPPGDAEGDGDGELEVKGEYGSKITRIVTDILARRAADPGFKAVVFSHWKPMLKLLGQAFAFNNIKAVDFSADREARSDALKMIKNDPETIVILVSMRAKEGAAGLTLTCCNAVYLVEPALYPGLEDQAIGRVNRIGQTRPTTVIRLVVKDTVEQKIEALQARKRTAKADRGAHNLVGAPKDGPATRTTPSTPSSPRKVQVEGAGVEKEELLTEEVCFIFDLDLDAMQQELEQQQEAAQQMRLHRQRIAGNRRTDVDF